MNSTNRNMIPYFAWFILLAAILTAVWFVLSSYARHNPAPAALPASDDVAVRVQADGSQQVTNDTAGYEVTVPSDWYVETKAGRGVAVYPDYDPTGSTAPACKIEISVLPNPAHAELADWLDYYLHADPTADITETSRTSSTISGYPAITWTGALNGIPVTLTYVARPDLGAGSVYEIAPSLIESDRSSTPGNDTACANAPQVILSHFQTLP